MPAATAAASKPAASGPVHADESRRSQRRTGKRKTRVSAYANAQAMTSAWTNRTNWIAIKLAVSMLQI